MKVALSVGLIALGMIPGPMVQAATDWTEACSAVGHFAGLVAVERDQHAPAHAAMHTVRRLLDQPWITDAVGDEITRQVYSTPQRSPAEETDVLRTECLTPVGQSERAPPPRAAVAVLAPIELNVGANDVPDFTPDGRKAIITLRWDDDGGGHGHDVFSVTIDGAGPVTMPNGGETVRDDPDHDRDMRTSIRFARGQIDGSDTALLLTATRQPGPGPTPTIYRVFRLEQQDNTYRFVPVLSRRLGAACNADMALSVAAGLPLRRSYRGAATANGCPESSQLARQE